MPDFQQFFTLLQWIGIDASQAVEGIMSQMDTLTLSGSFQFQACDDAICYLSTSLPVSLRLDIDKPDQQRASVL